jgi:hypothetical protein
LYQQQQQDTSMKSQALKVAHKIKGFFDTWSDALKAAWRIAKLFLGYPVELKFVKETGEIREARAIALGAIGTISKGYFRFVEQVGQHTAWKSCRIERMLF